MKDIEKYLLFNMIMNFSDPYDIKTYDEKVDECLMNMYFLMISDGMSKEKREQLWKAFDESFNKLNSKQQEIVKQDFIDIINNKNEIKKKVKKKGMINYE